MKKVFCIIITVISIFSLCVHVFAFNIQFQTADAPIITEYSVFEHNDGADINVKFRDYVSDAEEMREFIYSLVLDRHGSIAAIENSAEKYILAETKLYCEIGTDGENYNILKEIGESNFTLSLYNEILPFLYNSGENLYNLSENSTLYLRVTMASENITEENVKTVYVYSPSEPVSISLPSFCFIIHDVPDSVNIPVDIPRFFNEPLQEKIVLPNLLRAGYEFGGWYFNSVAQGVIPEGTEKMILTAKWNPLTYEINYFTSINMEVTFGKVDLTDMPVEYTVGTEVPIRNITAPVGYVFCGWYDNDEFLGEKIDRINKDSVGDITLYAKWITTDEAAAIKKQEQLNFIEENKYGDLDSDGIISAKDARLVLRATVQLEKLSDEILMRADYYGNGKILAANARTTLRISVGLEDIYEILLKNGVLPQ